MTFHNHDSDGRSVICGAVAGAAHEKVAVGVPKSANE